MVVLLRFDSKGKASNMVIAGASAASPYKKEGAFNLFDSNLYHSTVESPHAGEHGWRPTKDELKTAQGRNLPDSLINKLKETRKGKNKQVSAVSIQFRL